jgi:hypothetical protein
MKPLIHSKPSDRICEAGRRDAGKFFKEFLKEPFHFLRVMISRVPGRAAR